MPIEIKHRWSGAVIKVVEADTLARADLRGADLRGADLRGAYLRGAYLSGAYLSGADLSGADLGEPGATLIDWTSHDLAAELLRRAAAEDVEKRKIAGLILVSRDWCWQEFIAIADPLAEWALDTLAPYVKDGDDAPAVLKRRADLLQRSLRDASPDGESESEAQAESQPQTEGEPEVEAS